jgi:hypothetical protein
MEDPKSCFEIVATLVLRCYSSCVHGCYSFGIEGLGVAGDPDQFFDGDLYGYVGRGTLLVHVCCPGAQQERNYIYLAQQGTGTIGAYLLGIHYLNELYP